MLQIILASDITIKKINDQYKDRIKSLDAQIEQLKNQVKTADDKDDLKHQLDDLHKKMATLLNERDKKKMDVRKKNIERKDETSSTTQDFKSQVDAAWSKLTGKTGKFILNKMYPVEVTLNGKTIRFGMFKASGRGPIRLATLRKVKMLTSDRELSDIIQFYKFDRTGNVVEDGRVNLSALSPSARKERVKEFESLF